MNESCINSFMLRQYFNSLCKHFYDWASDNLQIQALDVHSKQRLGVPFVESDIQYIIKCMLMYKSVNESG